MRRAVSTLLAIVALVVTPAVASAYFGASGVGTALASFGGGSGCMTVTTTTTTLAAGASATSVWDESSCTLTLGIPAGATGATGAAGNTGAPGPAGLTGGVGPAGPQGSTGAAGAAGVSGYQVVTATPSACGTSHYCTFTATCPSGKLPIGGGLSGPTVPTGTFGTAQYTISQSYPSGQSWLVVLQNTQGTTQTFTGYVVCATTS